MAMLPEHMPVGKTTTFFVINFKTLINLNLNTDDYGMFLSAMLR